MNIYNFQQLIRFIEKSLEGERAFTQNVVDGILNDTGNGSLRSVAQETKPFQPFNMVLSADLKTGKKYFSCSELYSEKYESFFPIYY